jgi:hypothetical protein
MEGCLECLSHQMRANSTVLLTCASQVDKSSNSLDQFTLEGTAGQEGELCTKLGAGAPYMCPDKHLLGRHHLDKLKNKRPNPVFAASTVNDNLGHTSAQSHPVTRVIMGLWDTKAHTHTCPDDATLALSCDLLAAKALETTKLGGSCESDSAPTAFISSECWWLACVSAAVACWWWWLVVVRAAGATPRGDRRS